MDALGRSGQTAAPAGRAAPPAGPPVLRADGLSCGHGSRCVVDHVSFSVRAGEVFCVLGPNGAGKSTLFRTLLGLLPPLGGGVLFRGEDMTGWSRRRIAQVVGYVPQSHVPAFPYRVREVVLMGRTPQLGLFSTVTKADEEIAAAVMEDLGIIGLAERDYTTLSGGERQMVLVCRALAQTPQVLVMDEPTANLDFGNRVRVLERVRELAERGLSVVMTTHDPNQAFLVDGTVALMEPGGGLTTGRAAAVITPSSLQRLYGVRASLTEVTTPAGDTVVACVPLPGRGCEEVR